MTEAKLAPNLPDWMVEHTNRYLSSGGTDGHMYKMTQPGRPEITVPSLLLTTTGRKSGERFIFPLFYGKAGDSYLVVASKGGAPEHPGWYRNLLTDPERRGAGRDRQDKGPGPHRHRRRAHKAVGEGARVLGALRRLPDEDRARDPGRRARSGSLKPRSNPPSKPYRGGTAHAVLSEGRRPHPL